MTWIRKRTEPVHKCEPPMHEAVYKFPSASLNPDAKAVEHREMIPTGSMDDLWRCDECNKLWRLGDACDICDTFGRGRGGTHPGMCRYGLKWRGAFLSQRIWAWFHTITFYGSDTLLGPKND